MCVPEVCPFCIEVAVLKWSRLLGHTVSLDHASLVNLSVASLVFTWWYAAPLWRIQSVSWNLFNSGLPSVYVIRDSAARKLFPSSRIFHWLVFADFRLVISWIFIWSSITGGKGKQEHTVHKNKVIDKINNKKTYKQKTNKQKKILAAKKKRERQQFFCIFGKTVEVKVVLMRMKFMYKISSQSFIVGCPLIKELVSLYVNKRIEKVKTVRKLWQNEE